MLLQNIEKEILLNHSRSLRFFRLRRERVRATGISVPVQRLEDSLPDHYRENLENAFYHSLAILTGVQSEMVTRYMRRDELEAKFHRMDRLVDQDTGFRALGQMEREIAHMTDAETSIAILEGVGLGSIGVGSPETTLLCALMLRTLYETALLYGFNIDQPWERELALLLLNCAFSAGEEAEKAQRELSRVLRGLYEGTPPTVDRERRMRTAAVHMAQSMSLQKFVQSIPVIGVAGGFFNSTAMGRLQTLARCVYKQRYLRDKLRAQRVSA